MAHPTRTQRATQGNDTPGRGYMIALYTVTLLAIISTIYVSDELYASLRTTISPLHTHRQTARHTSLDRDLRRKKQPRTPRPITMKPTSHPRPIKSPKTPKPITQKPSSRPPPTPAPRTFPPTGSPTTSHPTEMPVMGYREYRDNFDVEFIWVMGYPFSGGDTTLRIVEWGTNKSMATNYGEKYDDYGGEEHVFQKSSVSIDDWVFPDGPFYHNLDMEMDSKTLLVKTHCGGTCLHQAGINCTYNEYMQELMVFRKFSEACRMGRRFSVTKKEESPAVDERHLGVTLRRERVPIKQGLYQQSPQYDAFTLKKAILMVRNPFGLVASRFRDAVKNLEDYETMYNAKGLRRWCDSVDAQYGNLDEFDKLKRHNNDILPHVPCWTEFFRIVVWYENACRILTAIDSHTIYFEDYKKHPVSTVDALMKFVGMEFITDRDIRFDLTGPRYDWFDVEELPYIKEYLYRIMSPDCVQPKFARYFQEEWLSNPLTHYSHFAAP